MPDENCYFYLDGANEDVRSSYMALTITENLDHFCESFDSDFIHDDARPTKHNFMCRGKPVWQVIQESEDFQNGQLKPYPHPVPPDTKFQVVRPEEARFMMVLDVSTSMNDHNRLKRLMKSSEDWIKFDVRDGSQVGIVSFK